MESNQHVKILHRFVFIKYQVVNLSYEESTTPAINMFLSTKFYC